MIVVFIVFACAAVALPLIAAAWAMRSRQCPHCGAVIEPDPALKRVFTGE
ncbi:MAG TPA: hypothetical protein VFB22_13595 [Candidatus Baltobacteraceae bacterium]|nr:hypothetical protein [Candidatus Baltobacteraceae bacterium]